MLDKTAQDTIPASLSAAEQAALTYVSDEEPGIRRKGSGHGFYYLDAKGMRIRDDGTLARIRALAIPPAYRDVWICADPDGHLQATGRDDRGRKQYRYHERWSASRDAVKYSSLAAFAESLPRLRERIDTDLRRHGMPWEKVVASIAWLLDNTMIRVGNSTYARENNSFGLTTLRRRHVAIDGATVRFAFRGKSGKEWKLRLVDRRMARIIKTIEELPGQTLFQYIDEDGEKKPVRSDDVNAYIRAATGAEFSSKHFRTWGGTVTAAALFALEPLPETRTGVRRATNRLIDKVAARLGNTRAVCRRCYIHPAVFEAWNTGTLADQLKAASRSFRKVTPGLEEEEMLVARWLERREKS